MVKVKISVGERALMGARGLTGKEKIIALRNAQAAAEKAFIDAIRRFSKRK